MKKIDNLLQRFKNLTPPDLFIRKTIKSLIESEFNMKVDIEKILFNQKTGLINLKINNTEKTAIFLKKDKLIKTANTNFEKDLIKEII